MNIQPDRIPVNRDAAKVLSGPSVPANTVSDALEIIARNLTGEISRQKIAETLHMGMVAKYTVQIRKCQGKTGCNVNLTFQPVMPGTTVAHFTELS